MLLINLLEYSCRSDYTYRTIVLGIVNRRFLENRAKAKYAAIFILKATGMKNGKFDEEFGQLSRISAISLWIHREACIGGSRVELHSAK